MGNRRSYSIRRRPEMKRNSRLSLALHSLGHMAGDPGRMRTSAEIASHAGTNPVVVKRVLGRLRAAGLLIAERGHAGGWRLARAPEAITLADVYLALDERLAPQAEAAAPRCVVEHALERRVAEIMDEAEAALLARLARMTIAEASEPVA
jgi:Rrf2 family protein